MRLGVCAFSSPRFFLYLNRMNHVFNANDFVYTVLFGLVWFLWYATDAAGDFFPDVLVVSPRYLDMWIRTGIRNKISSTRETHIYRAGLLAIENSVRVFFCCYCVMCRLRLCVWLA